MTTPVPRSQTAPDAMPTTRGLDFYATDPNLEFVCSTVLGPAELERARPHLAAMGRVAGGELDALAAEADRHPPVLRTWDARGQRVDEIVKQPAYEAMERIAFARFGLAAMSHREGVGGRLDTVTDARAKCWVDLVRSTLDDLAAQAGSWPARGTDERELEARPFADALYHSMATALLLAEGQLLVERRDEQLAKVRAALYARKWLCPPPPRTGAFSPVSVAWLDAIVDWTPVPADALGSAGPSR